MSSWWPKAWTKATTASPLGEDRHRHAQVGQVADAALGAVDVVVEEHVALAHLLEREVARDGVHERGVGAAGELAQQPVVDAGAEVVRVADHRAAAGAPDRGLDLHLDAGQRALDDLDQHRVGARAGVVGEASRRGTGWAPCGSCVASRVTMMLRKSSMRAAKPGWSGHRGAELLDDRRARDRRGPAAGRGATAPACRRTRPPASKQTGLDPASSRSRALPATVPAASTPLRISGRWIGPMPETRRLTHSTCWRAVAGEVVAVERPVLGVEAPGDLGEGGGVERPVGHRRPAPRRPARSSAGRRCGRTGARSLAKPSLASAARACVVRASYAACTVATSSARAG